MARIGANSMAHSTDEKQTLGPYTILSKLGEGGMGEVYRARDPRLKRDVALKVLLPQVMENPERRDRLLREARAAAALKHPNITTIYEIGKADGLDFLAFEYVDGPTLAEEVSDRRLSLPEIVDLAGPLADALAYAHEQGVIHRDVKFDNVMLTERKQPKLLDFGLAKVRNDDSWTGGETDSTTSSVGRLIGTPSVMSPEQIMGKRADERADVFSFGILLYRLASGRSPFKGKNLMETIQAVVGEEPRPLQELRPDLSEDFVQVVAKALRKEPKDRYANMGELAQDLRHMNRRATSILLKRGGRRRKRSTPLLTLVGVAVLVAALWLLWPYLQRLLDGSS